MIESYWLVHIGGETPIPVGVDVKVQVETALTEQDIKLIYFNDIFGGQHIVTRKAIRHLEISDPELRLRRARHNAEIHDIAGQAYFDRRNESINAAQVRGLDSLK